MSALSFSATSSSLFNISCGLGVRVVGPEVVHAYRYEEDHKRACDHEYLLAATRGHLGLLHGDALFGSAFK